MTTSNAFAFLLLGLAMYFMPAFWPEYFPPSALGGASTSALWLQCMAPVQATVGLRFIVLNEILPLPQMISDWHMALEWHPMREAETATT